MSFVNIKDVRLQGSNPCRFDTRFEFEIDFECSAPGLQEELEFKVIYVADAYDQTKDQQLDSVDVGPVAIGKNSFRLSVEKLVDFQAIKPIDVLDGTVMYISCCYRDQEFCRIGYCVSLGYIEDLNRLMVVEKGKKRKFEEDKQEVQKRKKQKFEEDKQDVENCAADCTSPVVIDWEKLLRYVGHKRKITVFPIGWDKDASNNSLNSLPFEMSSEDAKQANADADAAAVVVDNNDIEEIEDDRIAASTYSSEDDSEHSQIH